MPKDYINVIEDLYNSDPEREWNRLERHRTEYAVTMRALADHLPPAPARILDCGGGPGRYAIELSKLGYEVTLFDLSQELLDIAKRKSAEAQVTLAGIEQGSATDLSRFEANSFDAVLMMGPLYHLLAEENRRTALEQAYRVVKPGAPVFAAFINRYAAHRDCLSYYPHLYVGNIEEYDGILEHGQTFPMAGKQNFVAYFTHPSEIEPLCRSAGLDVEQLIGVEGMASACEEKLNALEDENWDAWVEVNYKVGQDRWALGNTEHILAVCHKPAWHQPLLRIIDALGDAPYRIFGGTSLALHGLNVPVNDFDFDMPLAVAEQFATQFAAQCTRPLEWLESDVMRSYLGSFTIDSIDVDVVAELEYNVGGRWVKLFNTSQCQVPFQGRTINVSSLEEEAMANIRRQRLDRTALILPHCDAGVLNRLLHDSLQDGKF